jgi:hypothetical protein
MSQLLKTATKTLKESNMPKRIYEFICSNDHITEAYIDSELRTTECKVCDQPAIRIISKPLVKLEGVTGDFPGAAMQWERKRNEKMAQERKSAAE